MVANHFMIAVLWLQTLSCAGYALKRSFTLKPTTAMPVLPVNGGWTSWTAWSTCTQTCGTGSTHRIRSCTNPAPQNNGAQCSGATTETKVCNYNHCSVDGGWASWTTWSTCTRSCGTGSASRARSCSNPAPQNNGAQCSGSTTETKNCNSNHCPVDGGWASWTTWSTCTRTCGTGSTGRTRSCSNPAPQNNGAQCSGSIIDTKVCNSNHCPVDGGWASWTTWSTCTRSCGTGSAIRRRSCSNPAPQNNGAQCSGSTTDTKVCNSNQCPVDGGWASWTTWSTCTRSCDTGSASRTRSCSNPAPQNNGALCSGSTTDTKVCNSNHCPVDGGWASWTTWSTCTRTCGTGSTGRTRSCSNPAPQNNGAQCSGSIFDTKVCNSNHCPVDGGWTYWTIWSTCTRSCGTGSSSRTRSCTNPAPHNNGAKCSGSPTEHKGCNYNRCPVDGGWTYWTMWSTCTRSCGTGSSSRTRSCTNPAPANNGAACSGSANDFNSCNVNHCPVNGGWGQWSGYQTCTNTCGAGTMTRYRYCNSPQPAHGGNKCYGNDYDTQTCQLGACPGTGTITSGTSGVCIDKNTKCHEYSKDVCTDPKYDAWVQENCCAYCSGGTGGGIGNGGTFISGGTMSGGTITGTCTDAITHCAAYGANVCTNPDYEKWVSKNCPRFCNRCTANSKSCLRVIVTNLDNKSATWPGIA